MQRLGKVASDGDVITLPAGTFTWHTGVSLTKGLTIRGLTTITGAGTATCTADDQTVIIDEMPRPGGGNLFKITVNSGSSFRLTGITLRQGTVNTTRHPAGAIGIGSNGLATNIRIDHCHLDHVIWEEGIAIGPTGWVYGVDDHNLIACYRGSISHIMRQQVWNNTIKGYGSWADYPYYGSEKFWFIEDNTILGNPNQAGTSGGIDSSAGGRYVARHNYFFNCNPNGHGTENGDIRGMRCYQIYDNTLQFTGHTGTQTHRGGSGIWHDNTFRGNNSNSGTHSALVNFREFNGSSVHGLWKGADGANGWDSNDPHGVCLSDVSASNTTLVSASATFSSSTTLTPHAFIGMMVRNDNSASTCYLHASFILDNASNTITYYYQGPGVTNTPLVFQSGDAFSIRKVLTSLDRSGRGKGDLINPLVHAYPNQQQETCFSWNNKNTDTGQVLGYGNDQNPNTREGFDYVNLGAGLPADTIPAQVTAAYPAEVNGGSAYTQEYVYPHPLVAGRPTPTPIPSSSTTATATATATATQTFHRAGWRDQYAHVRARCARGRRRIEHARQSSQRFQDFDSPPRP